MTKKIKTGLLIVAFIGAIIMILFVDYSVRGTATRDGYYKPHTVPLESLYDYSYI